MLRRIAVVVGVVVWLTLGAAASFGQVSSPDAPSEEKEPGVATAKECSQNDSLPMEDDTSSRTGKSLTDEPPAKPEECVVAATDLLRPTPRQVSLMTPTSPPGTFSVGGLTGKDSSVGGPPYSARAAQAGSSAPQQAEASAQELAKKLSNPVASLISVPFQHNFDFNMGPNDNGFRYTMNFQPVIPFSLNEDWNLISRTIVPFIHQDDVIGTSSQTGLGDIVQSFFFSPNKTQPFIWGVGPVLLLPTATDELLGTEKFGLGPTVVILKQQKGWTYGALWNHIWSVAGDADRADVNTTFFQPFVSYTTKTAWTFTLNTESAYDWEGEQWSVPIQPQVSKLVRFGKQPVSFSGGLRCWATSPPGGPEGCGFRVAVTLLFPR